MANKSFFVTPPLCHEDESSALLQFKQSLSLNESASYDPSSYPKTNSWKLKGENSSCCLWDGVECDRNTAHVIGLHLSSSFLYGSISSNSCLFSLVHLQRLDLADNNFHFSQIPPEISHLSSLSSLNLSLSVFSGQIPSELLRLTKLTSLDLSSNFDRWSGEHLLKLENPSLRFLVQNLTNLKEVYLHGVNVTSEVPAILANMTSITALGLSDCGLYGQFPKDIFLLPDLCILDVSLNRNLTGYLPDFPQRSSFKELILNTTNLSGNLPVSIGNLATLNTLDLDGCHFSGSIPASLGNLTQLTRLFLSFNNFNKGKLSWLGKQNKLTQLMLRRINLYGEIPSSLANLTQLTILLLRSNHFSGEIPSWVMNMTQLNWIDLSRNQLHGPISSSFSQLKNLKGLDLSLNNLSGNVEASIFLNLKQLTWFSISFNKISFLTHNHINSTLPQFGVLQLASCNLREIPYFLQFQNQLNILFLQGNNIHGQIPQWMWNVSAETLATLYLSFNFLTGFENNPVVLPDNGLRILDIKDNMLQGNIPVPPPSTQVYDVSNNRLTGNIPPLICHMNSLYLLDLSNNSMSGTIPQCLGNFSNSLAILNLKGNKFSGIIPQTYTKGCSLEMMDLSQNQLEGQLPRSLENCMMLETLDLNDNQIEDTFPFWLGVLPKLQVLVLRSNRFHGAIGSPRITLEFPTLRIIDLSGNYFTGNLPLEYIKNWNAMKISKVDLLTYMQSTTSFHFLNQEWTSYNYSYSITLTNKGVKTKYVKIQNILTAVDFSSNKFKGEIPDSFGSLKGLELLNLSNNALTGSIPPSLGNLTELESLDLSRNKLSGDPSAISTRTKFHCSLECLF